MMSSFHTTRRTILQQLAALPLLNLKSISLNPPPSVLTQLNVIIHGLAIIAVYEAGRPRLEIILPAVPPENNIGQHVYRAGNFLGTSDDDCNDKAELVQGETYTLCGVSAGPTPPAFELDRNLVFSASGTGLYVDPQQAGFAKVILPFPSVSNSNRYSFVPAKRAQTPGSPDLPFCSGSAISTNQGSITQLALTHIFSYTINKPQTLRLQPSSCDNAFQWVALRKNMHPQSTTANLLIYAEPEMDVDGSHASHAFEHLTELLPHQNSPGKLDMHFFPIESSNIVSGTDPALPSEVELTDLASLSARCTKAVKPANCIQLIVAP
ncbi:MAG: hypothetical protein ACJ71U_04575 [Terriglobales bacterium]